MQSLDNNTQAFLALVRAGLWEQDVRLLPYGDIEWQEVYRLATEQSVLGLILAGLEHSEVKPPKELLLEWIGEVQMIEQRNKAMNGFVSELIERLRKEDISCVLVKGQGVAQCYEKPLLRSCGDIDLLLDDENYHKAKDYLTPFSSKIEVEDFYKKHFAMTINSWEVELHGTLRCGLWRKVEKTLDSIQTSIFYEKRFRTWIVGGAQVPLPYPDEDIVYVFSHILQHFFKEGVGLRQICDWSRLLWTYKDSINHGLLYSRICSMGCLTEWKAFAALSLNYLGMSTDAIPFYSRSHMWSRKANRILTFILETGNFGHKRDYSQYKTLSYFKYKVNTFCRHTMDSIEYFFIFPIDAIKLWLFMVKEGVIYVARGK